MSKDQAKQEAQRIVDSFGAEIKDWNLCCCYQSKLCAIKEVQSNIDLLTATLKKMYNIRVFEELDVDAQYLIIEPLNDKIANLKQIKSEIELL